MSREEVEVVLVVVHAFEENGCVDWLNIDMQSRIDEMKVDIDDDDDDDDDRDIIIEAVKVESSPESSRVQSRVELSWVSVYSTVLEKPS